MSIATAIQNAQQKVANCYTAISNKGGTLPATQNLYNMPTAINSIPSGSTPTLITKTITQNGTYNASSDNADGYSSVTVNVSGGGGYSELPSYQVSNGVASKRSKVLDGTEFSSITSVDEYGLYNKFYNCTGLVGNIDFSNLTSVSERGLYYTFYGCTALTGSIDLSSLTYIGNYALSYAFYDCSGFSGSVDLSSVTTVGSSGLANAFFGCSGISSVNLKSLNSIATLGLQNAFRKCTGLKNVYFNSLKTTSFGNNTNQFGNMVYGTGANITHTLHFPSNLQTTISGLSGYPTFGGTSGYVTLAFDLPATS